MKQDITTIWKTLAAEKQNTSKYHIQYCILRAIAAKGVDKLAITKYYLRKAFSPVTSVNKLANGAKPFGCIDYISARVVGSQSVFNPELKRYETVKRYNDLLGVPSNEILTEEEIELYTELYDAIRLPEALTRYYSYFFTRQDIFEEYQLVQTAHAALELGNKLTPEQVKNLHFTCCGVEDLEALENVTRVLSTMKIPFVEFREPDIGNQLTAIGVYPISEHKRGILRNYNLLRFKNIPVDESVRELEAA